MTPAFQPFDLVVQPGMPETVAVQHYCIGILILEYPAKPDMKGVWVDPAALKKYGPDLKQTLENIYREVLWSQKTATVRVTWVDGKPELNVVKRKMILIPGEN